jgi:hypothetical protein
LAPGNEDPAKTVQYFVTVGLTTPNDINVSNYNSPSTTNQQPANASNQFKG